MALTFGKANIGGAAYRRAPYFRTKKLALLGNTDSIDFTPWHDPTWTLAAHPCCRPRCKREPDWYFDLHRPEVFRKEHKGWNHRYFAWLKALQTPIFMQKNWPEIPMSVEFPLPRIQGEFRNYFTNHCAFLIALALTEGVTHIGLFGCQYSHETEHGVQRDSLTYWLGFAEARGVKLVIPPKHNTLLCSPPLLYGYESHDERGQLVQAYRSQVVIKGKDAKGVEGTRVLKAVSEQPLMVLPGEAPAWERSGLPREQWK